MIKPITEEEYEERVRRVREIFDEIATMIDGCDIDGVQPRIVYLLGYVRGIIALHRGSFLSRSGKCFMV